MKLYKFFLLVALLFVFKESHSQNLVNSKTAKEHEAILIGFVKDINKVPEKNSTVTIISDDKTYKKDVITDVDGKFEIIVPKGKKYNLTVMKMGMEFSFVSTVPKVSGPLELVQDYIITLLMTFGRSYELHNINFESNKWDITQASIPSLDSLVSTFKNNPMFMAEIAGHTDNIGDEKENTRLSQRRADAIRDYLIGKGIEPSRIFSKGYGERNPVASNDTEEGRFKNRRTEVKVIFE